jgi:hypothetical protein
MLTENIQKQTPFSASFLNVRKQERSSLPSALYFLYSAIVPTWGFSMKIESIYKLSIENRKRFEIVETGFESFNGRRHG